MKRHTRVFVLLLVASLVIAVAPAASGASHGLKATFEVISTSVIPPGSPEILVRCPKGWDGWIFEATAEGTLTVGKTPYPAQFKFEHCSRFLAVDPERETGRQVGKSALGEMTITTPQGALDLKYGGTWTMYDFEFAGPVPVVYTSDLNYRYAFVEESGSGVFKDVSRGHGHLAMTLGSAADPNFGPGWMAGSLK